MPWKGKEEVIDCASSDKTHPGSGTDPGNDPVVGADRTGSGQPCVH